MSTSLQIKIASLLGYVVLSTTLVVMSDANMPAAGFSPSPVAPHRAAQ